MAATKFTEAEREKLFAQLEAPFDPALIKWRVMRTFDYGRSGVILPFADPRAYTDRLNALFTPSGWTGEYTITTVPSLCRMERGKAIMTSKVLVAAMVTIVLVASVAFTIPHGLRVLSQPHIAGRVGCPEPNLRRRISFDVPMPFCRRSNPFTRFAEAHGRVPVLQSHP